jgi:carbon-monoxide dehydrogenase medium subunit
MPKWQPTRISRRPFPALAALAGKIGDPHVRHRGTIGGSVANADPAADYPAALLALNAKVVTDSRTIEADKFFKSLFRNGTADQRDYQADRV